MESTYHRPSGTPRPSRTARPSWSFESRLLPRLLLFGAVLGFIQGVSLEKINRVRVKLDVDDYVAEVEEFYLSVCLDSFVFAPDKSPWFEQLENQASRVDALLSPLAPALFRVGGTYSSFVVFDKPQGRLHRTGKISEKYEMTKSMWDALASLTQRNGLRFLFDLNAQLLSSEKDWDSTNAMELIQYSIKKGYATNIDWELGNEPVVYDKIGLTDLSPDQIAESFVKLRSILNRFPEFQGSRLIGPDPFLYRLKKGQEIVAGFLNIAGNDVDALTYHHYYMGNSVDWEDFLDPDKFDVLAANITQLQLVVSQTARPDIPMWQGETGICFHSAVNATKTFVSGFLWLDKLGLSARMGTKVVMRQAFYGYKAGLIDLDLQPRPDYWLSVLHKMLVGTKVLNVEVQRGNRYLRVYAHCTNHKKSKYQAGAVTICALNYDRTRTHKIVLDSTLGNQNVDAYVLTPVGPAGVLSGDVALNGQKLEISDNLTFPDLDIAETVDVSLGITLPPLTYGFFVLPRAGVQVCRQ